MRKIILCAVLLLCNIWFIKAEGKQYFGVQVGFTQPITRLNQPVQGQEKTLAPTTYNGLKIGLLYDATLIKGFGYSIGLNYTFAGHQSTWTDVNPNHSTKQEKEKKLYHQLELPVDWQYKFEIAQDFWLMLYTGPTLQFGLDFGGKSYTRPAPNQPAELKPNSVKDYYDNAHALKRINVTWGVGAGIQYERYFIRGGYDFGLINPYKAQMFDEQDIYTRGRFDQWQIKLGMYLWEF